MSTATINSIPVERCSVTQPEWGLWTADVQVMSGTKIEGPVTLVIADTSFIGVVIDGGVYEQRGWYRIVGGAGGWRKTIDPLDFRNEAGVKLSQVVGAAARAAGEHLGVVTERRIGPAFGTARGEASLALELLAPEGWYVDPAGITHVAARPSLPFAGPFVVQNPRPDRGLQTLATEHLAGLVPGCIVNGQPIGAVRIELTPEGLRAHVWAKLDGWGDRLSAAFRRLVQFFTRKTFYFGRYEYLVDSTGATHVDIRPARSALGLPRLAAVPLRSGVPHFSGEPELGSSVEVQFLDGDPTRPVIVGYENSTAGISNVKAGSAEGYGVRVLDKIVITGLIAPPGGGTVTCTPGATFIGFDPTLGVPTPPGAPGSGRTRLLS